MSGGVETHSAGRFRRVEWSELERLLLERPGWRRIGSELKGPCPLCGGRDRCWARPGDTASALLSCRVCEAPFGELLLAVTDSDTHGPQPETSRPPRNLSAATISRSSGRAVGGWRAGRERDPRRALPSQANRVRGSAAFDSVVRCDQLATAQGYTPAARGSSGRTSLPLHVAIGPRRRDLGAAGRGGRPERLELRLVRAGPQRGRTSQAAERRRLAHDGSGAGRAPR